MTSTSTDGRAWRRSVRFDMGVAALFFVACETEVVIDRWGGNSTVHWPVPLEVLAIATLTIALLWRRLAPLAAVCGSVAGVVLLQFALADVQSVNFPQFVLFIPPYSVAAYADRKRALVGLAVCLAPVVANNDTGATTLSSWTFSVGAVVVSWGIGRAIRARRLIVTELEETTDRISAERDSLERLAVAEQRTKIAQELQTVVAESVSAMIVQAGAARRLLEENLDRADNAMATIEDTGRGALGDMRRILGALRHSDAEPDLAPLPGIGRIAALVERSRRPRRRVCLRVEGDPRPVPASVDIALYRILEDAMVTAEMADVPSLDTTVSFGPESIELTVQLSGGCLAWPTSAMCDLTALGDGGIEVEQVPGVGERLTARFPITFVRTAI